MKLFKRTRELVNKFKNRKDIVTKVNEIDSDKLELTEFNLRVQYRDIQRILFVTFPLALAIFIGVYPPSGHSFGVFIIRLMAIVGWPVTFGYEYSNYLAKKIDLIHIRIKNKGSLIHWRVDPAEFWPNFVNWLGMLLATIAAFTAK